MTNLRIPSFVRVSPLPPIPESQLNGPPEPERRLRFMEIVRRRLRERRYSARTEVAYVFWIRRFIVENGRQHPSDLGEVEVARFLSGLALKDQVAASTQNQALSALVPVRAHNRTSARARRRHRAGPSAAARTDRAVAQ